jgi:hypothetical protein
VGAVAVLLLTHATMGQMRTLVVKKGISNLANTIGLIYVPNLLCLDSQHEMTFFDFKSEKFISNKTNVIS